jgi:hypothetical protein
MITARIDSDFKSLETYFQRLFELHDELVQHEREFPIVACDVDAEESQAEHFYASHLIKPDMIIGIYSCFEFWIQKICSFHQLKHNLALSYRDIRGKHDLHTYHKYLTLVAGLNLDAVHTSYQRLDDLRKVRNTLVHCGGHIPKEKENELSKIDGISVAGSLVVISDEFVRDLLTHAKCFAVYVAKPTS